MAGLDPDKQQVAVASGSNNNMIIPECSMDDNLLPNKMHRSDLTRQLLMSAIDQFISSIRWSSFKTHYNTVYKKDRGSLRGVYKQVVGDLKTRITEEITESVLDDIFVKNLARLDKMVEDSHNPLNADNSNEHPRVKLWRPSKAPEKDLKPHRVTVKLEAKAQIEEILRNLKQKTATLRQSNMKDNHKLCEYEQHLRIRTTQLNKVVEACHKLPYSAMLTFLNEEDKS